MKQWPLEYDEDHQIFIAIVVLVRAITSPRTGTFLLYFILLDCFWPSFRTLRPPKRTKRGLGYNLISNDVIFSLCNKLNTKARKAPHTETPTTMATMELHPLTTIE